MCTYYPFSLRASAAYAVIAFEPSYEASAFAMAAERLFEAPGLTDIYNPGISGVKFIKGRTEGREEEERRGKSSWKGEGSQKWKWEYEINYKELTSYRHPNLFIYDRSCNFIHITKL